MVSSVNSPSKSSSGDGAGWEGGGSRDHRRTVELDRDPLPAQPHTLGMPRTGPPRSPVELAGTAPGPQWLLHASSLLPQGDFTPNPAGPHRSWGCTGTGTLRRSQYRRGLQPRASPSWGNKRPIPSSQQRGLDPSEPGVCSVPSRIRHHAMPTFKHLLRSMCGAKLLSHLKTFQQPLEADL